MADRTFRQAQADMRDAYFNGGPGVLVSGLAWLVAGLVAVTVSHGTAVIALLVGGAAIHLLSVALAKLFGRRGAHDPGNPLAVLAGEGTIWFLSLIAIAFGLRLFRLEWFFPAMLLIIGGRYLTFQTLYGLRLYWVLGGVLSLAGMALALTRVTVPVAAFTGGAIELVFASLFFRHTGGAR